MPEPSSTDLIRVDSVEEEHAYVAASPPDHRAWSVHSQSLRRTDSGAVDTVTLRTDDGDERRVRFDISSFYGTRGAELLGASTTGAFDAIMERAADFAAKNGAHHPGSLPRFPVPSDRYPGRLDVPLPVLAVGDRGRALYAPVRVVTMTYAGFEPFGVGEFPGFDPDAWPPPRLANWPPASIRAMDRVQLQASVSRFSALAMRLYGAYATDADYPQSSDERREYRYWLGALDVAEMEPYYRALASRFFRWLHR